MSLKETGFCWKCGRQCVGLFCSKPRKCEEQFKRDQARQVISGKRAAYGIKGDTH